MPASGPTEPAHQETFLFVKGAWDLKHTYRRDPLSQPVLDGLAEHRLLGVRDPVSNRVLFPPHSQWDEPYGELTDLVDVGPAGIIRTLTILPGREPQVDRSIVIVHVQLDGCASAAPGQLRGLSGNPDDPLGLIGARCHAVFADQPTGAWTDYWYELGG